MPQKLLTAPIRIGYDIARTSIRLSVKTAETAIGLIPLPGRGKPGVSQEKPSERTSAERDSGQQQPSPAERDSGQRTATADVQPDPRRNGQAQTRPPAPPAPPPSPAVEETTAVTPPDELPATPLTATEDRLKTVDDEDEVVAEVAEPGAEDGAGPQLQVAAPWEGYESMRAADVVSRIEQADAATIALLELYEQGHKRRRTVLEAATRRLRDLSPPSAS